MANCEKIVITGFAGAGKSTLLGELKKTAREGWESFLDLDGLILSRHAPRSETLTAFIQEVGWEKFRAIEETEVMNWLKNPERGVLALGGGSFTQIVADMGLALPHVLWIHLDLCFDECWKRISADQTIRRPHLLEAREKWEKTFHERSLLFQKIPHQLDASLDPKTLAKSVWKLA